jgi:hypothetical protein
LSKKELTRVVESIYALNSVDKKGIIGENAPKVVANTIMLKIDINNDKKISESEFLSGCKNDPYVRNILFPK